MPTGEAVENQLKQGLPDGIDYPAEQRTWHSQEGTL